MNEFAKSKILVIEDEDSIRENIVEMLTDLGYQVSMAKDGVEGISQTISFQPHLILCDIMMPKMDGYQVLQTLRNSGTQANIPFIFLTSLSESSQIREGILTGADDYLTKPFKFSDIIAAIENRLKREQKHKEEVKAQILKYRHDINKISSHEYNTPLSSILGFLNILTENFSDFNETEVLSMLELVTISCKRLKKSLDNSQLYSLLNHIDPKDTQYKQYTEGCVSINEKWVNDLCLTMAHESEISLDSAVALTVEIQNAELSISESNFRKVLEELLDNAIKFSDKEASVHIAGIKLKDTYQLSIANQGREFKTESIEQIGPYTQFEREKYEQQGLGLGLWIAKELIRLNHGQLTISSGKGNTVVTVDIQLYEPHNH
jgi:two-component system sensor histidine kinase/response regulator